MNLLNRSLLIVLFIALVFSCKKEDVSDKTPPILTIASPTEGAVYSGGQAIHITGSLTDESLHELTITITNDADGSTLFTPAVDPEVHDETSYVIDETWTPTNISAETSVTLTAVAEDHSSNFTTKTVKFKVKP